MNSRAFFLVLLMGLFAVACEKSSSGNGSKKDGGLDGSTDSDSDGDSDSDSDGDSDADSDTDADGDGGQDPDQCADAPYEIEINPINMLIVLDRSRSMLNTVELSSDAGVSNETYADVVSDALKALVAKNDESDLINFGLSVFPSTVCTCDSDAVLADCKVGGADLDIISSCTASDGKPGNLISIAPDNSKEISGMLDTVRTCGGTPICESMKWALTYLESMSGDLSKYPTYVLLATDGAPNCNNSLNKDTCECTMETCFNGYQCLDDTCSYNWTTQLATKGYKTFVIGVGDDAAKWDKVMNGIASAGGTDKYYPATDPSTLQSALETITGELVSCEFDVAWDEVPNYSPPPDEQPVDKACNKVKVFSAADKNKPNDKVEIPYSWDCSNKAGWRWKGLNKELNTEGFDSTPLTDCTTIELCDNACSMLKKGESELVSAVFGCAPNLVR